MSEHASSAAVKRSSPATSPRSTSSTAATSTVERGRVRRHHRAERRRQVHAAEGDPRPGPDPLGLGHARRRGHHRSPAARARRARRGFVPQNRNVFPSLTVRENLEMGCFLQPPRFEERFAVCRRALPPAGASGADQRAGSLSGGERQMVAMGRALMPDPKCCCSTSRRPGFHPRCRTRSSSNAGRSTETGVAILMVEQNARRCLQVCHRGYVLDQGRNAYTGTGRELLADPKVIELYLGTLARAGRAGA